MDNIYFFSISGFYIVLDSFIPKYIEARWYSELTWCYLITMNNCNIITHIFWIMHLVRDNYQINLKLSQIHQNFVFLLSPLTCSGAPYLCFLVYLIFYNPPLLHLTLSSLICLLLFLPMVSKICFLRFLFFFFFR